MSEQPTGPVPVVQPKKRKKWPWITGAIAAVVIVGGSIGAATSGTTEPTPVAAAPESTTAEPLEEPQYVPEAEPVVPDASLPSTEPTPVPQVPVEVQNAILTARSYVEMTGFSKEGLIKQLEFEGYPTDVAAQAVESLGVDWNSEAVETAQSYMGMTSFSRSGLIGQLTFEGFTQEQAEYAVNQIF